VAYDEDLAARVRDLLAGRDARETRMFGGLAFLVDGQMAVAVSGQGGLLLRCDPGDAERHLREPGVEQQLMRGRPATGWLHVGAGAVADDAGLRRWLQVGLDRVDALGG
jgi:hypothetical protein